MVAIFKTGQKCKHKNIETQSRFTSGLNAAKNTHYIQKYLKLKLLNIEFRTKKAVGTYVYLHQEWS